MGSRFNNIQDDAVLISRGTGEIIGEFGVGSDISCYSKKEREAIQRLATCLEYLNFYHGLLMQKITRL